MSSHVATALELPGERDSARWELVSFFPTALSETRVDLPPPEEISTPFGTHHPKVSLLGWAAIGLPHPEGWLSRGRTTPRDRHGTEWTLVAAIDGVAAVALAPIRAIARMIRRNVTTLHCGTPLSSMAGQGLRRSTTEDILRRPSAGGTTRIPHQATVPLECSGRTGMRTGSGSIRSRFDGRLLE